MKANRFITVAAAAALGLSAIAQNAFRDHRYDSFKATPTEPGQIVFAGNSITHMHSWFEAFGSHQEVIGRGDWGGFATELLDNLESYIDSKPARFFLRIGTNDLGNTPVETVARLLQTTVKRVRLESPETEIYVESILPRNQNSRPQYEECNRVMRAWVENLGDSKVHYIYLSEILAGVSGNAEWTYDALHPRPKAYAAWTHFIAPQVGYESVYPTTVTTQNGGTLGGNQAARVEQFPFYPVNEGDVLFFGDEMVHGGEWHELLRSNKIKDRGLCWTYGGISLTNAKSVITVSLENQAKKPAKAFLFYGVGGKDQINYRALVDEAKKQMGNGKVYVVSLTPSANAATDAENVTFNTFLQTVATEKGVTYVDIYTPLKQNVGANLMNTNYISGRGYVVIANALAPYLQEENVRPVSLEEYDEVYARRTARSIIGKALTRAFMLDFGDGKGQIPESERENIESKIPALVELINSPTLTSAEATTAVAELTAAVDALLMPKASTNDTEYWYTLTSSRGTTSTLTAVNGKLVGAAAPASGQSNGSNIWKFMAAANGTYHIVNGNKEYLSPAATANTQLKTSATAPSTGWNIGFSNIQDAFVIYTANCQLNQTNFDGFPVYNWSGVTPPNLTDDGCAYYISLYDDGETPGLGSARELTAGQQVSGQNAIYDLNGRRMDSAKLLPGIYINKNNLGSRKFIVR